MNIYPPSLNYQNKTNKHAEHCWRSKDEFFAMFSYGPLHTDMQVLAEEPELIYNSSVRTQDVILKTCRK